MLDIEYVINRIRDVKLKDYMSIFPMSLALLIRPFYRNRYGNTWLICEEPAEARDNGYHFFKYMCEKQPQQKCYYAIKKRSVDAKRVEKLGQTIEYGSLRHWLVYFLCEYNISSQKGGKPNAAICAFMELNNRFKTRNVFLQHGVTINNVKWLYADVSKIDLFITATSKENKFIIDNFGYSKDSIKLTGFPRFDALHEFKVNKNQILVMPTWRYWFNLNSKKSDQINTNIRTSEYVRCWTAFLKSELLKKMIDKYELKVIFFLHRNMQNYIAEFDECKSRNIVIASWKDYDIQDLLKSSEMLITDYSSVFFDMVYMKKPVVFYQFDKKDYRKYQYDNGYFDYENNAFGKCTENITQLANEIERIVNNNFSVSYTFIEEHEKIFTYYDSRNNERVYHTIKGRNK